MKRLLLMAVLLGASCAQGQSLLGRYYPDPYRMPWNYHGYYPSYGGWYGGGGVWTGVAATAAGAGIAIAAGEATRRLDEAAERRRTAPAKQVRYEDCQEYKGEKSRILKCTDSNGKAVTFEIPN